MIGLPCPNCGRELALLDEYHRHYCYACGLYAPEGYGDRGMMICPTCGGILSYVLQYDRYYCFRCNAYPAEGVVLHSVGEPAPETSATQVASNGAVVIAEPVKPEEPTVTSVEVPAVSAPQSEELAEEEIPPEEVPVPRTKPPLVRDEILQAKKPALMDLCKAYDLDPTGTKEQLRERLLSYVDELEAEAKPETTAEETSGPAEPTPTEASETVERQALTPVAEASEVLTVEEEAPQEEPAPLSAAVAPEVVEPSPAPQPIAEAIPTTVVVEVPETQPARSEAAGIESANVMHPCPTCGRELSYIARYRRWYCYSCRAYAPATESRFACPNCGATLRWIEQYDRWWCDACRRYAPVNIPKPEPTLVAATSSVSAATPVSHAATFPATAVAHRHRNPGTGIDLVAFGILLFVLYEVLVDLPAALSINLGIFVSPDLAFGLRFFAFVFLALGVIVGLAALRHRS